MAGRRQAVLTQAIRTTAGSHESADRDRIGAPIEASAAPARGTSRRERPHPTTAPAASTSATRRAGATCPSRATATSAPVTVAAATRTAAGCSFTVPAMVLRGSELGVIARVVIGAQERVERSEGLGALTRPSACSAVASAASDLEECGEGRPERRHGGHLAADRPVRDLSPFRPEYWRTGKPRIEADTVAAAEGLLDAGADEVIVLDNHGSGNPENVSARLSARGRPAGDLERLRPARPGHRRDAAGRLPRPRRHRRLRLAHLHRRTCGCGSTANRSRRATAGPGRRPCP